MITATPPRAVFEQGPSQLVSEAAAIAPGNGAGLFGGSGRHQNQFVPVPQPFLDPSDRQGDQAPPSPGPGDRDARSTPAA